MICRARSTGGRKSSKNDTISFSPFFSASARASRGLFYRGRHRLLHEHMLAGVQRLLDERAVRFGRRGDDHGVDVLSRQHGVEIGRMAFEAETVLEAKRSLFVDVDAHEEAGVRHLRQREGVAARDAAATDQDDAQGIRHFGSFRSCLGGMRVPVGIHAYGHGRMTECKHKVADRASRHLLDFVRTYYTSDMCKFPHTLPSPRVAPLRGGAVLNWGVLAPGDIARDFVRAMHAHTDQRAVAVAGRSPERARAFAEAHGIGALAREPRGSGRGPGDRHRLCRVATQRAQAPGAAGNRRRQACPRRKTGGADGGGSARDPRCRESCRRLCDGGDVDSLSAADRRHDAAQG